MSRLICNLLVFTGKRGEVGVNTRWNPWWCQLCHPRWHRPLSQWRPAMPPVTTKLASRLSLFNDPFMTQCDYFSTYSLSLVLTSTRRELFFVNTLNLGPSYPLDMKCWRVSSPCGAPLILSHMENAKPWAHSVGQLTHSKAMASPRFP